MSTEESLVQTKTGSESLVCQDGWISSHHGLGFSNGTVDSNMYFKVVHNHVLLLVLYVNDLFLTGDEQLIEQCKRELISEFEMKDLRLMHYFLGLEVWQKLGEIFLTQGKYAVDILQRFGLQDCKSMSVPMITNLTKLRDSATSS